MRPLISLDIFDTALFRDVFMPTDVFDVVEQEVGNNFKKLRLEAQRRASSISIFCDLVDIYKNLPQFNMKEEIRAELLGCKPNPYILNMYNTLNADFIFISDMYLPSNVLIAMLKKCGYLNPRVFVSCELKACKGDGKLFTKVENLIGRKIDKHIGDNYNADIEGAKKVGIPEVEYIGPSIYKREVVTPVLKDTRLRKFLIDNELSDKPIEEKIGYLFAPLTLAFTQKVLDEAKDNQTIFFNARDGFLMYIVARWILKTKKKIKYCRFSRKSCLMADLQTDLPIIHFNNQGSFQFLRQQRIKDLEDFLNLFNFKRDKDFSHILKLYEINLKTPLEFHPKKRDVIKDIVIFFQEEIYKKAREEKENFLKYLESIGIKDNDIFVDIGYRGTMQGIIKRVADIDLKGRYIYTFGDPEGNYYGIKYEKTTFLSPKFVLFFGGAVLEVAYTEPVGTVTGYLKDGKPVLLKDLKVRKDVSKKLLKGTLKGCKELLEKRISISHEDCEKIMARYLETPTLEEAEFGNQNIFENGSNGNESITWFDETLIRAGKIKECFNKSYWRPAFKLLLANSKDFKDLESKIK